MSKVTAIVLVLNEQDLIQRCLTGLAWADEILVVDSGSADDTAQLAASAGARVERQDWLGWTGQHNAAAALATNAWVFFVDADEYPDEALQKAVRETVNSNPPPNDGFAVDRREEFLGALLGQAQRRSKMMTRVRLYNRDFSKWDPSFEVHERVAFSGRRRLLPGNLYHWRRETLSQRMERLNRYSKIEADLSYTDGTRATTRALLVKPAARLLWLYVLRGDFARGRRGLAHSITRSFGDFLRAAYLLERQQGETPEHPPVYRKPFAQ